MAPKRKAAAPAQSEPKKQPKPKSSQPGNTHGGSGRGQGRHSKAQKEAAALAEKEAKERNAAQWRAMTGRNQPGANGMNDADGLRAPEPAGTPVADQGGASEAPPRPHRPPRTVDLPQGEFAAPRDVNDDDIAMNGSPSLSAAEIRRDVLYEADTPGAPGKEYDLRDILRDDGEMDSEAEDDEEDDSLTSVHLPALSPEENEGAAEGTGANAPKAIDNDADEPQASTTEAATKQKKREEKRKQWHESPVGMVRDLWQQQAAPWSVY